MSSSHSGSFFFLEREAFTNICTCIEREFQPKSEVRKVKEMARSAGEGSIFLRPGNSSRVLPTL